MLISGPTHSQLSAQDIANDIQVGSVKAQIDSALNQLENSQTQFVSLSDVQTALSKLQAIVPLLGKGAYVVNQAISGFTNTATMTQAVSYSGYLNDLRDSSNLQIKVTYAAFLSNPDATYDPITQDPSVMFIGGLVPQSVAALEGTDIGVQGTAQNVASFQAIADILA